MNRIIIIVGFLMLGITSYSQVFVGQSTDKRKPYTCRMEIIEDSLLLFHYATKNNEIYGCHLGTLKKVDDNVYHVSMTLIFGKFDVMNLYVYNTVTNTLNDTDYFSVDTTVSSLLGSIEIKYKNGQFQNYSNIQVPLEKKFYNKSNCCNYYTIQTSLADPITKTSLKFMVRFGSSPTFVRGESYEFDIKMTDDSIQSINGHHLQTGQFKLKKSST